MKDGMYEVGPLQAIFTTISMAFAEARTKGTITQEQETTMLVRLNDLLQGVLQGKVLVWQSGEVKLVDYDEAMTIATDKGLPVIDTVKPEPKPEKTLRIGGKK